MIAVFTELAGRPLAIVGAAVRENATRKYLDLLRYGPAVFVAIASGVRHVFNVDCDTGQAVLRTRTSGLTPADVAQSW